MVFNRLLLTMLGVLLVSSPALPQTGSTLGDTLNRALTKENVGRAVGAAAGAFLGSKVGHGGGRVAAIAVGTLAGYWIGGEVGRRLSQRDRVGIAQTTQNALDTGQPQTWRNPDTGVYTQVSVREAGPATGASSLKPKLAETPALELVNEFYVADANVNVRGGPGTEYVTVYRVAQGERVPVVGKVADSEWAMIADQGKGRGFVYLPLFSRSELQPPSHNAIREAVMTGQRARTYLVEEQRCSIITQEVTLPNGATNTHEFKACQQPDGTWVQV